MRTEYRFLDRQGLINFNSHATFLMKLLEDVFHPKLRINIKKWNYRVWKKLSNTGEK